MGELIDTVYLMVTRIYRRTSPCSRLPPAAADGQGVSCQRQIAMSQYVTFNIAIPTDADGSVGRACDAPSCKQYFKIYVPDHGDFLHCPYCGTRFSRDSLLTSSQLQYAKDAAIEEARVYAINEFQNMIKNAFRGSKNITCKSGPRPQKKTVKPRYVERVVDTEFQCPDCSVRFQVYGIFGYCPGCV